MAVQITIEVPEGVDPNDVAILLRDALWDFQRARGATPEAQQRYVVERYAEQSPRFRAQKRDEVAKRVALAQRLTVRVPTPERCSTCLENPADPHRGTCDVCVLSDLP